MWKRWPINFNLEWVYGNCFDGHLGYRPWRIRGKNYCSWLEKNLIRQLVLWDENFGTMDVWRLTQVTRDGSDASSSHISHPRNEPSTLSTVSFRLTFYENYLMIDLWMWLLITVVTNFLAMGFHNAAELLLNSLCPSAFLYVWNNSQTLQGLTRQLLWDINTKIGRDVLILNALLNNLRTTFTYDLQLFLLERKFLHI